MKLLSSVSLMLDRKCKSCLCTLLITASLVFSVYFVREAYLTKEVKERFLRWQAIDMMQESKFVTCKNQNATPGTEALPRGIIARTSDLEMQSLWNNELNNRNFRPSKSLVAIAVGIRQKELVDQIVEKFPSSNFTIMLFHYDGLVDLWKDLAWNDRAIHVSATNQTKWWFAKRFLHPDIVAQYEFIFLWDEDLGVENFDPLRYLSIVKEEGLEISQPALDPRKSTVNHRITARMHMSRVHRRTYSSKYRRWCIGNSPPCTGWVEMMAPVFSRAAWRCAWYMIQNDLSHAWGLDMKLGYCAQGDRTKNVGIIDDEYIVHLGLPTLGGMADTEANANQSNSSQESFSDDEALAPSDPSSKLNIRKLVRKQSEKEMWIFNKRWLRAVKRDTCWVDPYRNSSNV